MYQRYAVQILVQFYTAAHGGMLQYHEWPLEEMWRKAERRCGSQLLYYTRERWSSPTHPSDWRLLSRERVTDSCRTRVPPPSPGLVALCARDLWRQNFLQQLCSSRNLTPLPRSSVFLEPRGRRAFRILAAVHGESTLHADTQTRRPTVPQTLRPADPQTLRPADAQTLRPAVPQSRRPSDPQTLRHSDPQTLRPADPQSRRRSDPQTRVRVQVQVRVRS
ncbi:hypothetical protein F2P81_013283 [Scophthalmus maximus]|uniref:Uncharacterized protein n=1 Tax=Scophthalmus maximus TaxID=52904 RepID=A0A6A4SSD9_SCOMX|nr:hypothetical protein F2P81_013283 [Scophthalmus maximus]